MKDTRKLFLETMVYEIGYAEQYGCILKTPVTHGLMPLEINNPKDLSIPTALIEFYAESSNLNILWEIVESDENTKQFKEDEFLIERFFKNDYSWGVIKDFLTGFINISSASDLFNPDFNSQQTFYYTLKNKTENEDDFFAFDIQSSVTACLKKEGNAISDNVWLIHTDAEKVYDMKITIDGYLQLAYEAKCIRNWQLVYLFKDKAEEHAIMKRFIPKIFGHAPLNLSGFSL